MEDLFPEDSPEASLESVLSLSNCGSLMLIVELFRTHEYLYQMDLNSISDPQFTDYGDPTPAGHVVRDWEKQERLETQGATNDLFGMESENDGE